jgi:hypothetical protein
MRKTYDQLGQPGIFRNDRFWLAGKALLRIMPVPIVRGDLHVLRQLALRYTLA